MHSKVDAVMTRVRFQTAYNPNLRYSNGEEMPPRPKNLLPKSFDIFYVSDIKNYEKRVAGAIDLGYVIDVSVQTNPSVSYFKQK